MLLRASSCSPSRDQRQQQGQCQLGFCVSHPEALESEVGDHEREGILGRGQVFQRGAYIAGHACVVLPACLPEGDCDCGCSRRVAADRGLAQSGHWAATGAAKGRQADTASSSHQARPRSVQLRCPSCNAHAHLPADLGCSQEHGSGWQLDCSAGEPGRLLSGDQPSDPETAPGRHRTGVWLRLSWASLWPVTGPGSDMQRTAWLRPPRTASHLARCRCHSSSLLTPALLLDQRVLALQHGTHCGLSTPLSVLRTCTAI